jgi:hypothetical protein
MCPCGLKSLGCLRWKATLVNTSNWHAQDTLPTSSGLQSQTILFDLLPMADVFFHARSDYFVGMHAVPHVIRRFSMMPSSVLPNVQGSQASILVITPARKFVATFVHQSVLPLSKTLLSSCLAVTSRILCHVGYTMSKTRSSVSRWLSVLCQVAVTRSSFSAAWMLLPTTSAA